MADDASPLPNSPQADDLEQRMAAVLDPLGGQFAIAARRMGATRGANRGATISLSIKGPASGEPADAHTPTAGPADTTALELRADQPLPAGALAYLPVVIELLRRADLGQFTLAEDIGAARGETAADDESAQDPRLTLDDLCARAIADGDAAAAATLLDLVGMGEVNETLSRINLKQTHLVRGFVDTGNEPAWRANVTSARDMLTLLGLARGTALPGAARLRALLAAQRRLSELVAALPERAELAHLPALGARLTHDVGLLDGPGGACAYCLLVTGVADAGAARAAIVTVVRLLWEVWCAG